MLVMLVSAFQRLLLYEAAYGFSRLRTYSHVFIIWLGALLVVVVLLEVRRRQRSFASAALLVGLGFAISLNLLNVDAFIVHQNVNRTTRGEDLDVSYLASLSDDAVPALREEYFSSAISSGTRDGVGAVLACRGAAEDARSPRAKPWQSFHLSRWNADRVMKTIEDTSGDYQVKEGDGPLVVVSPDGTEYPCWGYID